MSLCCYFSTARCCSPDWNWNCMSSRDFRDAWMDTLAIFGRCPEPGVCAVKP